MFAFCFALCLPEREAQQTMTLPFKTPKNFKIQASSLARAVSSGKPAGYDPDFEISKQFKGWISPR
jgi:hypothetical protein